MSDCFRADLASGQSYLGDGLIPNSGIGQAPIDWSDVRLAMDPRDRWPRDGLC
jgi:hypothetical protein